MIEGDATDGVESPQVVFVGIVQTMPGYDVKGRMCLGCGEEVAVEFREDGVCACGVFFETCYGGLEVPSVGEAV